MRELQEEITEFANVESIAFVIEQKSYDDSRTFLEEIPGKSLATWMRAKLKLVPSKVLSTLATFQFAITKPRAFKLENESTVIELRLL